MPKKFADPRPDLITKALKDKGYKPRSSDSTKEGEQVVYDLRVKAVAYPNIPVESSHKLDKLLSFLVPLLESFSIKKYKLSRAADSKGDYRFTYTLRTKDAEKWARKVEQQKKGKKKGGMIGPIEEEEERDLTPYILAGAALFIGFMLYRRRRAA